MLNSLNKPQICRCELIIEDLFLVLFAFIHVIIDNEVFFSENT